MQDYPKYLVSTRSPPRLDEAQLAAMVEQYPDATLAEYCEYWGTTYNFGRVQARCAVPYKNRN